MLNFRLIVSESKNCVLAPKPVEKPDELVIALYRDLHFSVNLNDVEYKCTLLANNKIINVYTDTSDGNIGYIMKDPNNKKVPNNKIVFQSMTDYDNYDETTKILRELWKVILA